MLGLLPLFLILGGCGGSDGKDEAKETGGEAAQKEAPTKEEPEKPKETKGYLEFLVSQPDRARAVTALASMKSFVSTFKAMHGRNPKDLKELRVIGRFPTLPRDAEYSYDAEKGEVTIVETN